MVGGTLKPGLAEAETSIKLTELLMGMTTLPGEGEGEGCENKVHLDRFYKTSLKITAIKIVYRAQNPHNLVYLEE